MKFNKLGLLLSIVIILIIIFIITYSCTCKKTNNYENFISRREALDARANQKFKLNKAKNTADYNYGICDTKYNKLLKVYKEDNTTFNTIATKWSKNKVSKSVYDEAYAKNLQNSDNLKAKEIECKSLSDIKNKTFNDWQNYNEYAI